MDKTFCDLCENEISGDDDGVNAKEYFGIDSSWDRKVICKLCWKKIKILCKKK